MEKVVLRDGGGRGLGCQLRYINPPVLYKRCPDIWIPVRLIAMIMSLCLVPGAW